MGGLIFTRKTLLETGSAIEISKNTGNFQFIFGCGSAFRRIFSTMSQKIANRIK